MNCCPPAAASISRSARKKCAGISPISTSRLNAGLGLFAHAALAPQISITGRLGPYRMVFYATLGPLPYQAALPEGALGRKPFGAHMDDASGKAVGGRAGETGLEIAMLGTLAAPLDLEFLGHDAELVGA